jgi:hypothetical protein
LPPGGSHPFPLLEAYREFVIDQVLQETVIDPLCRDVETHLRLAVHHKNFDHMQAMNPKKDSMKQFRQLLNSPSLHVCGTSVDIKGKVEQYLNKTFYNLTAAALPDAQTYNEMKILAKERFGLVLAQSYLPVGSLEQGIDVLNIMSDIHGTYGNQRSSRSFNLSSIIAYNMLRFHVKSIPIIQTLHRNIATTLLNKLLLKRDLTKEPNI